ncbi:MAG: hypothetical protein KDI19_12115, partial [Pseudomonadales bacterium]|nr:hypothetical protein [Pseudomonadales bacterium]
MTIVSELSAPVALVRDAAACPRWAALCKESRVVRTESETDLYVYNYNDLPWPVSDRDAVAHVVWHQDPSNLAVTMTATAVPGIVPEERKAVRLVSAVTRWRFEPVGEGRILIVSEAHVDPEGPIPAWITNMLLVDSPLKTMQNMREELATGEYDNAHFDFVVEPAPLNASVQRDQ